MPDELRATWMAKWMVLEGYAMPQDVEERWDIDELDEWADSAQYWLGKQNERHEDD